MKTKTNKIAPSPLTTKTTIKSFNKKILVSKQKQQQQHFRGSLTSRRDEKACFYIQYV